MNRREPRKDLETIAGYLLEVIDQLSCPSTKYSRATTQHSFLQFLSGFPSSVLVVYLPTAGFSISNSDKVPCHKSSSDFNWLFFFLGYKGHKGYNCIGFLASSHHTRDQRGVPALRERGFSSFTRLVQHFALGTQRWLSVQSSFDSTAASITN